MSEKLKAPYHCAECKRVIASDEGAIRTRRDGQVVFICMACLKHLQVEHG